MVTDGRILAGMARQGFIVWKRGQSDRHWTGMRARRLFVSPGPKLEDCYEVFTYRGHEYRLRYVDGCFHPFVFRSDSPVPAFV